MAFVGTHALRPWASWTQVPVDRVIRIADLTPQQLTLSVDPLPDGAPVVITFAVPQRVPSATELVDDVLDQLEHIARSLFPSWLPDGDLIAGISGLDRRVVRELAHRLATTTDHFGHFLADIAEAALLDESAPPHFAPAVRARGLTRIIERAYDRASVVVALTAEAAGDADLRAVAPAAEWLVNHARVGVWLVGAAWHCEAWNDRDRFPAATLPVPPFVRALAHEPDPLPPVVEFPALTGRPHPGSATEQKLEGLLARCGWARGRSWNHIHASPALSPPIRVDLMWPAERCVVEIDGPDHRGILKYADDRRRDNGLMLDGFAVLRFSNEEIDDDPRRVLAVIEKLLTTKRLNEGNQA